MMSQNGHTRFKNVAAFATRFSKTLLGDYTLKNLIKVNNGRDCQMQIYFSIIRFSNNTTSYK